MKGAILTFHRAHNYGAVLQSYALQTKMLSLGIDNEIVDYVPECFYNLYYFHQPFKITHPPIKTWIRHFKVRKVLNKRNQAFESFIENRLNLSNEKYYCLNDIESANLNYDFYLTGSDQVWNNSCARFDKVFFLDFVKNTYKYSYAASFGFDSVPTDLKEEYKKRLSSYEKYSVREESGKTILKDLLNVDAQVNCDPTLLLTKNEWENLLTSCSCPNDKYILVYYVTKTKKLQKLAEEIAAQTGYKVIILPCNMSVDVLNGSYDSEFSAQVNASASPEKFLSLIKNAEYVLTNSFHGTVFSIIFHKKFISQINLDDGKKNNRAVGLLKLLDLEERTSFDIHKIDNPIDWYKVDSKLEEIRNKGAMYLKSILNDMEAK